MVASARLAAAARIILEYSPGGANLLPHLVHSWLSPHVYALRISIGSAVFAGLANVPNRHTEHRTCDIWSQFWRCELNDSTSASCESHIKYIYTNTGVLPPDNILTAVRERLLPSISLNNFVNTVSGTDTISATVCYRFNHFH